jgi:hypothetical protein
MAHFSTHHDVFDQESYEEAVSVQADILITLDALRHTLQHVMLNMADLETEIYGNSLDTFDNQLDGGYDEDHIELNTHT